MVPGATVERGAGMLVAEVPGTGMDMPVGVDTPDVASPGDVVAASEGSGDTGFWTLATCPEPANGRGRMPP
jgi:hypothetical protein